MSEPGFTWQQFVSATEKASRECSLEDCSKPVAATYSMARQLESGKIGYEVAWACEEHEPDLVDLGESQLSEGTLITGWAQELLPTCLRKGCDDNATHVVHVARGYDDAAVRLEAMSVCSRHAEYLASSLEHVSGL